MESIVERVRRWWGPVVPERRAQLRHVHIGLTTNCQLRCRYCAVSQPWYVARDLPRDRYQSLIDVLRNYPIEDIDLYGHGESTILPDWTDTFTRFYEAFPTARFHLVSNLSKRMNEREYETLSRLQKLSVSIDTADPERFAYFRRGARLERVLENLREVRRTATQRGLSPVVVFNCTVTDGNVFELPNLVKLATDLKITKLHLRNYKPLPDSAANGLRRADEMIPRDRETALSVLENCHRDLMKVGIEAPGYNEVRAAITESLRVRKVGESMRARRIFFGARRVLGPLRHTQVRLHGVPGRGQTRDCLDPWKRALINPDQSVMLCCQMRNTGVGNLAERSLDDILQGAEARKFREGLLSGRLMPECQVCPSRGLTKVETLRDKVDSLLGKSK